MELTREICSCTQAARTVRHIEEREGEEKGSNAEDFKLGGVTSSVREQVVAVRWVMLFSGAEFVEGWGVEGELEASAAARFSLHCGRGVQ